MDQTRPMRFLSETSRVRPISLERAATVADRLIALGLAARHSDGRFVPGQAAQGALDRFGVSSILGLTEREAVEIELGI